MSLFRPISLVLGVAILGSGLTVPAAAEPMVSMSGPGWTKEAKDYGFKFACFEAVCTKPGMVLFMNDKVVEGFEQKMRDPSITAQDYVENAIRGSNSRGVESWKIFDSRREEASNYVVIYVNGQSDGTYFAMAIIGRGDRGYLINSLSDTESFARDNLKDALESANFGSGEE